MNAILLTILGLLALSTHSFGLIVCPTNYCDDVACKAVTAESCDGKIVSHGTFCGCCDACRTILKKGQFCGLIFIMGGLPPTAECDTGLTCGSTSTCVEDVVV